MFLEKEKKTFGTLDIMSSVLKFYAGHATELYLKFDVRHGHK